MITRGLDVQRGDELAELFACLPAPTPGELDGVYRGRLLGVPWLDRFPRELARWVYAALATAANPWRGKAFEAARGHNRWVSNRAFGRFRVEDGSSTLDGRSVVSLDYDVAANPPILRRLRGEVRRLGDDSYLARFVLRGGSVPRSLGYFTLTRGRKR